MFVLLDSKIACKTQKRYLYRRLALLHNVLPMRSMKALKHDKCIS